MIRGERVDIGGAECVVPPFTIGLWERFDAALKSFDAAGDKGIAALVRTFVPLLVENIRRNAPDFALAPDDWDLPTFLEVRAACLVTSRPANPPQAPANLSTGAT